MRTMTLEEKRESLNNVLDSINELDDIVLESDADVLLSMGMTYNKASVILENYDYYDYNEIFAIFQEEDTTATQSSEPTANSDMNAKAAETNQNAKKGFFAFFVNIFKKIIQFFKDAWNGRIAPAFNSVVSKVTNKPIEEEKVPLWKAIFTKPMSFIKEHATEFGIGIAAVSAIGIFKFVLSRLDDDNSFKQAIVDFFNKMKIPVDMTKLFFKITIADNAVALASNFSFKKLGELFSTHIPNFFKAELALVKNLKSITQNSSITEDGFKNLEEQVNATTNAINAISTNLKSSINANMTPEQFNAEVEKIANEEAKSDLINSFDELQKVSKTITSFNDNLNGLYKDITTIIGDDGNKGNEMLSNIKERVIKTNTGISAKFDKASSSLLSSFEKTTLIGGAIGGICNIFGKFVNWIKKVIDKKGAVDTALGNSTDPATVKGYDPVTKENWKTAQQQDLYECVNNQIVKVENKPTSFEDIGEHTYYIKTAAAEEEKTEEKQEEPAAEEVSDNSDSTEQSEEEKTEEKQEEPAEEASKTEIKDANGNPITNEQAQKLHDDILDQNPDFHKMDNDKKRNIIYNAAKNAGFKINIDDLRKNFPDIFKESFFYFDDEDADIISESWYNKF